MAPTPASRKRNSRADPDADATLAVSAPTPKVPRKETKRKGIKAERAESSEKENTLRPATPTPSQEDADTQDISQMNTEPFSLFESSQSDTPNELEETRPLPPVPAVPSIFEPLSGDEEAEADPPTPASVKSSAGKRKGKSKRKRGARQMPKAINQSDSESDHGRSKRQRQSRTPVSRARVVNNYAESSEDDSQSQLSEDDDEVLMTESEKKRRAVQRKKEPKPAKRLKINARTRRGSNASGQTLSRSCSGIVKSLKMWNFMCHDGFYQEWHPNLNFVTGENGSGKSALLTGLLIGLGGKATLTSRTKTMSALIQKEKTSARTEIALLNNGALPVEKYGHEVVIERTITRNGSSSYRLKVGEGGKMRPMKKHELDSILTSFNIQLDNPVAILNQEVAKNFLRTKDPKDKYKLFHDGTLLTKLFALVEGSRGQLKKSKVNIDNHEKGMHSLAVEVEELQRKLEEADSLAEIKKQLESLGGEFLWAVVNEETERKQAIQKKLDGYSIGFDKIQSKIDEAAQRKQELEEQLQPDQGRLPGLREEIKRKESEVETVRNEINAEQRKIQSLNAKIKLNKDVSRKKQKLLNDTQAVVANMRASAEVDKEEAIREYEERKERLLEEKRKAQSELAALQNDNQQFLAGAEAARNELFALRDDYQRKEAHYNAQKRQLTSLQSNQANRYSIFGPQMVSLMDKIERNVRNFHQRPKGPIAAHLKVKDGNFANIVEFILQREGFLMTFIVDNNEDLLLLKKLIQETYNNQRQSLNSTMSVPSTNRMPSIKMNSFLNRVYDIDHDAFRSRSLRTLLSMIEVENNDPVIINGLIDYLNAERIIMFDDNQSAAKVMKDQRNFPSITRCGYTRDFYRFLPAPDYAALALPQERQAQFLKSSKKAQIEALQRALSQLKESLEADRPILQQKEAEAARLKSQLESITSSQESKRRVISQIERSLKENEATKYKEPDIASHVEEINSLERELQKLQEDDDEHRQKVEEFTNIVKEKDDLKKQLDIEIAKLNKEIERFTTNRHRVQEQIQDAQKIIDRLKSKLDECKKSTAPLEEEMKKCEATLERKIERAQETCDRVDTRRKPKDIKDEVEKFKTRIETMEQILGDLGVLRKVYAEKSRDFALKQATLTSVKGLFCILKEMVVSQAKYLLRKRAHITNSLTFMFEALASERGYKGVMTVDHEKGELNYVICPDKSSNAHTERAKAAADAQQSRNRNKNKALMEYSLGLSGGERSFSTICFIISLWQVMECPFYMLDEFDVFMDAFNRKSSQQALIQHATTHTENQFFLFSPLDLTEIPSKEVATVIRLKPARPDNDENTAPHRNGEARSNLPVPPAIARKRTKNNARTESFSAED